MPCSESGRSYLYSSSLPSSCRRAALRTLHLVAPSTAARFTSPHRPGPDTRSSTSPIPRESGSSTASTSTSKTSRTRTTASSRSPQVGSKGWPQRSTPLPASSPTVLARSRCFPSTQNVADLKGKTVGVNQGSVSEWFLAQVLEKNGLHLSDVREQNMTSGAAGAAFVASKLDVAVTWEPWLSKAKARTDGHVLVSSKQYLDLIMDSFAFRKDFIQKYPDTVKDFMKAYYDAFTWMQANQTEALKVIGDAVQESPSDVSADLSTMTLFDLSTGKQVIGTSSSHGKIYDNVKAAADFWKAQGKIDTAVNPSDAVDPSFINSL
ncbi:MAG: hypothetical protein E6I86_04605 [Chloroflexi bacterium]|nr:MAG: hypothetical protein E6I86_04605 [Chloroflexota bacterium]